MVEHSVDPFFASGPVQLYRIPTCKAGSVYGLSSPKLKVKLNWLYVLDAYS